MENIEAQKVLYCAMCIGEQLLASGAEVGRVEDTISRICVAYGAKKADVFCITSTITTTMYGDGFFTCTQTRRVTASKNDMTKLDELNKLSRRICETTPPPEQVKEELSRIKNGPRHSFWTCMFIYGVASGAFAVFFGGDYKDMLSAAMIGVVLKCFERMFTRLKMNNMIVALLCSSIGGLLANLTVKFGIGSHVDLISIGNIMLFIPGMAFVNSLRDLFMGDTATGGLRCLEALVLAMVIAIGFTFANFLFW